MRKVFKALVIGIGAAAFSMLGYFSGRLDERYEYENAKCVPEKDIQKECEAAGIKIIEDDAEEVASDTM